MILQAGYTHEWDRREAWKAPTAEDVRETITSQDWDRLVCVSLIKDEHNWLESAGCLASDMGIATMLVVDGVDFHATWGPSAPSGLLAFFQAYLDGDDLQLFRLLHDADENGLSDHEVLALRRETEAAQQGQRPLTLELDVEPQERSPEHRAYALARLWQGFRTWLTNNAPEARRSLKPPLRDDEIEALERSLRVRLPATFRKSLVHHNGQDPDMAALADGFALLPDHEIVDVHDNLVRAGAEGTFDGQSIGVSDEIRPSWFHPCWIPVARANLDAHVCLDLAPSRSGTVGQVILVDSDVRMLLAPDFQSWLSVALERTQRLTYRGGRFLTAEAAADEDREVFEYPDLAERLFADKRLDEARTLVVDAIDALLSGSLEAFHEANATRYGPRVRSGLYAGRADLDAFGRLAVRLDLQDAAIRATSGYDRPIGYATVVADAGRQGEAEAMIEAWCTMAHPPASEVDEASGNQDMRQHSVDALRLRARFRDGRGDTDRAFTDRVRADTLDLAVARTLREARDADTPEAGAEMLRKSLEAHGDTSHPWAHATLRLALVRLLMAEGRQAEATVVATHAVFERFPELQAALTAVPKAGDPLRSLRDAVARADASGVDDEIARAHAGLGLALMNAEPEAAWPHLECAVMRLSGSHPLSKQCFQALERLEDLGLAR